MNKGTVSKRGVVPDSQRNPLNLYQTYNLEEIFLALKRLVSGSVALI